MGSLFQNLLSPPSLVVEELLKINHDVISTFIQISRVIHPLFPCLTIETIPFISLITSTPFNSSLKGGQGVIPIRSFQINCQILLCIMCTNLWAISHASSLTLYIARFLYQLFHGDSVYLPSFICHHMLRIFYITSKKIGLPYACLIRRLVPELGGFSLTGLQRVYQFISHTTISQSRSSISSSSALYVSSNPTIPFDLIGDLLYVLHTYGTDILPTLGIDIPSSSISNSSVLY